LRNLPSTFHTCPTLSLWWVPLKITLMSIYTWFK
jgi:hypothetical protein